MKNKCRYNIISEYIDSEKKDQALLHMKECMSCAEKIIAYEHVLHSYQKNAAIFKSITEVDSVKAVKIAEDMNKKSLSAGALKELELVLQQEGMGEYLIQMNQFISSDHSYKNLSVPIYLKNIVNSYFETAKPVKKQGAIMIYIGETMRLLNSFADHLHLLPTDDMVPVRSSGVSESMASPGLLQFISTSDDSEEKILYQVVKDGENSAMLTIRLQNFKVMPKLLNVKRENRLLHSFPVKVDYAYFPKMEAGQYNIELKDASGTLIKQIDVYISAE